MSLEYDDLNRSSWTKRVVTTRLRSWRRASVDWLRLFWGALLLNTRKSLWIWRGRPQPAPCQSESDSGLAGETRCDASAYWGERRRFRRICPHLQQQADGDWRCGVDAAQIRPFWGRAAAWWGGTLTALWLVVTLPAWAVLWKTGVRVPYWEVAWPGGWSEVAKARGQAYVARAEQAMVARRYDEMVLCLQSALRSDPQNFPAHVYMANLAWAQGNYAVANDRYQAMMRDYPAQRPMVARAWLPKLLVLGDMRGIKEIAQAMLTQDPGAAGPWSHALIFSARQTDDPVVLVQAMQLPNLPAAIRPILAANAAGLAGQRSTAWRLFGELMPAGDQAQFIAYQQIEGLLEFGAPDKALELLDTGKPILNASDRLYFRLRAFSQLGWGETSQTAIRDAFHGIDLPRLDAIAVYLVRCHDRPGLIRVLDMMALAPRAEKLDGTFAMLYLAAGLWGDRDLMPAIARLAAAKSPLSPTLLARFDQIAQQPGYLGEAMGVLPLPMEAVYAAHSVLHATRRNPVHR
ncbi:MAG: tetratricopeptide repeat protein [Opitutales bacterium]